MGKLTRSQIAKRKRLALSELHHWQMMGRIERRWVRESENNARHYAAILRDLQKLENQTSQKHGVS